MDQFRKYADIVHRELGEVLAHMNDQSVETALQMIERANRIVLLSGGREGLALKFFAMRLMHLGKDAHWATSDTCPAVHEGDLFICVGGAGGECFVLYTEKSIKQTGAQILCVTANPESEMARLADGVLVIPKEIAEEVIELALEKAAGEKLVRKAIEGGMSATDAFAKFGIL